MCRRRNISKKKTTGSMKATPSRREIVTRGGFHRSKGEIERKDIPHRACAITEYRYISLKSVRVGAPVVELYIILGRRTDIFGHIDPRQVPILWPWYEYRTPSIIVIDAPRARVVGDFSPRGTVHLVPAGKMRFSFYAIPSQQ